MHMSQSTATNKSHEPVQADRNDQRAPREKPSWETPKMEDVSEQVMAQPYIRFT
jgi:hypothetical protein